MASDVDVVLDDRKERFGFKMKDAELIGFPYTVIIGKELENNQVQIYERVTGEKSAVDKDEIYAQIMERVRS
jgi:prolyl-tRNA synthetase